MALMRGPTALRQIVSTHFAANFPAHLDMVRTQWGVTTLELPDPIKYDAYDPFAVGGEEYPTVGMYVMSDTDVQRRDYDSVMAEEFSVQYSTRIFCAVMTPKDAEGKWIEPVYESTVRLREDMTTALKTFILGWPNFGNEYLTVMEESITTDYPELMRAKSLSNRFIGAGVLAMQIQFTESLYRDRIGTANTIEVIEGLIDEEQP